MTLGQRVAVMRGGVLQQCDTPEELFDHPREPVRGGVHRLTGDEPDRGRGGGPGRRCAVPVPARSRAACILGVRPHDLKLGAGIPAVVQVVERLGTETHVVAGIDARACASRRSPTRWTRRPSDDDVLLAEDDRASFTVVLDARAPVAVGDRIELTVEPDRRSTGSTSRRKARRLVGAHRVPARQ